MKVLITSPKNKEHLVAEFEKYCTVVKTLEPGVSLIIPTVDEELPFFASSKEWFQSQGIEVMVGSENTIFHCRDKAEFNLFCGRHGFQTPRTRQLEGYLKPRFGKGSRGIVRVTHSFVYQERCEFPEVSIDYFADSQGNCISLIPRYRLNIVDGESKDHEIVPTFNDFEVRRLGQELGLIGHNVIQGYWTGEVFIFGEVNPRFGGGSWMTFDMFSSPKYLVENLMRSDHVSSISRAKV